MADGYAASVLVHSDAGDQTHDPRAGCPDESTKQTDKAGPDTEKPDGISCTGSNSVLPRETLEGRGCPSGVTPARCDETLPGQDSIIPVEPEKNLSHSSETQPAVIDTHSANVMPNQSDTENTPDKGCLMREDVEETPTQVTTHSQVTKDINTESSIGESDHQIASSCDVGSQHSNVSQHAVACENGACDGGGAEKSPSKTSESTPRDVELSMSNISLCSHDSSSRATGLTSESFTGSESGLEYESDSYETGSTGSSATTTSRTDTSSNSITSPGTKSMQKRVDKVMNRLSESETANSEALDEIHGAIRDTINATMNVLDNDPPSTSSNDSELTASPVRQNRDSHQKNGTVSNEAVKSLPQDNHNHSSTLTPPGDACLERSDVKGYSDNSEELLSELSAELELVGQTGSIEAPNGIASQVVSSLPEFKRLQAQLESVTTLCGRQQLQLDRLHVEKQESVASLELIYQAQIKELERTISKQDAEVRHVKEKLTSHDAAAKRAVGTLQEQLKLRVDQVTKMYRESMGEKDNMVMKYAQAEQRNIELADRMAKMDAARREFLKEKELAVGRFRSVVTEKQRLQDLLDAKSSETVALKRELERLRDQMTSSDIKVKWMENKLKAEVESHKETRGKVDDFQKGLRQAKEETEQIRRNCQAMILTYQDSEEIKSNSLDTQLRAKEELLQKLKLDKASEQEQNRIMSTELNHLKVKHSELLEELHTYKDKVQCQETERLVQEQTLDKFRETLQAQKHRNHTMKERLQLLENVEQQLLDEQARAKELKEQVTMLEESNTDLQANMESCSVREMEHLEFTQKISGKNARIQSENITLNSTLDSLREEHEKLLARSTELQEKVDQLEHELAQEREEWKTENDSLASRLAVKEKQVDELKTQLGDEKDENRTLKRRHAANIKDIMRQFQQAKRRLEVYEHRHGDHDSIGSNASSNGSLDTASTQQPPAPHSRGSSQEPTPPPPPQEEPFVEVIEIDKQMLLEKIVRLQKSHARKNEKIEFMEDHIQRLIREVQKKTRIIQSYVLREDAGSLAPAYMDVNKALLSRHGGIMASVFSSHSQDGALTLDLSLEINRKLQAVVEDVLLKNITLKENIDTLGTEIARLSQENRQLQLRMQEAPLVNSNT